MESEKPQDAEVLPVELPSQLPATQPKTNAVVRLGTGVLFASVAEVWALADNLRKGGAGPKGATTASIAASIIKGQSLGLDCVTAMSFVTVVNGRASLMGDLALGLIRKSGLTSPKLGGYLREEWVGEGEERTCIMSAKRHDTGEEMTRSFSVAQARTAGLIGKTAIWTGFLDRMLRYRALGFLLRDLFSDILLGLYLTEELQDGAAFIAPPEAPVVAVQSAQAVADAPDPFFAVTAPEPPKALVASTVIPVIESDLKAVFRSENEPMPLLDPGAPPPDLKVGQIVTATVQEGVFASPETTKAVIEMARAKVVEAIVEAEPSLTLAVGTPPLPPEIAGPLAEAVPFEGFRDAPPIPERIEVKPAPKAKDRTARPVKVESKPPYVKGATRAEVIVGSSTVAIIRNPNATTKPKAGRLF